MKPDVLVEVSWEVCNKVGGIHTVLTSKLPLTLEQYSDYIAIGPYFQNNNSFLEGPVPEQFESICNTLEQEGIVLHFGKWLVNGEPLTILVDFQNYFYKGDDIKKGLWEEHKIDSLRSGHDYTEPIVFSHAVGKVTSLIQQAMQGRNIVLHCHEWMAGGAILYCKKNNVQVGTVFTTHATILGRTLASNHVDLYKAVGNIDPEAEAKKYGIESKHGIEGACAHAADVFTTVSDVTSIEAEAFLGKKADVLLYNGIDMTLFPSIEQEAVAHNKFARKIHDFLSYYFLPHYPVEIKDSLLFFTAGRYEFRDKGMDIYLKSLEKLNTRLKKEDGKTVFAFVFVPGGVSGIDPLLLQKREHFHDIDDGVSDQISDVKEKLLQSLLMGKKIAAGSLLSKDFMQSLTFRLQRFKESGNPPFSSHHMQDIHDAVLQTLGSSSLNNGSTDKVKVVFYPIYLAGADGLLDLSYYEAIQGCDLGVFPSYYEPWGYTPMETAAFGIPSITSSLSGFGQYIGKQEVKPPGIFVLDRNDDEQAINDLAQQMYDVGKLTSTERSKNKQRAKDLARTCDWSVLIENYLKAHEMSLK